MYKCIKISVSNFFTITILSLHNICSESKNYNEMLSLIEEFSKNEK